MSRSVTIALVFLTVLYTSVYGQNKTLTQLPRVKAEPFKIERGSSFSASVPRESSGYEALSENTKAAGRGVILQDYVDAIRLIRANHSDGERLDYNELNKSSIESMLRALDPHSNYYDRKEYEDLLTDERSEYIGVGASIVNYTRNGSTETYVTATFPESPAYRAGLRFGDKIVSVAGENMTGRNSLYVREKIRGVKGTIARLTVERAGSGSLETIDIKRGAVAQPSVPDAYLLRPGVGYIDLTTGFTYTTGDELDTALKNLHEQGMTSLILDLRDNPGGILEQAVRVTEKFLPAGQVVVKQRGRTEIDNRTWKSNYKNPSNVSLVLLVDGGSASASEIVTGALQDYDRALIVGEKTFGKGLVQSVIDLPYGAGLTLTTAKYYTPSGRLIQRDYSNGNLYDYYQHRTVAETSTKKVDAGKTITGRNVYGGDGITPDEIVKPNSINQSQINLLDALFFFAREVVGGKIKNLENSRQTRPVQFAHRVRPSDFPDGDALFTAFKDYSSKTNSRFSAQEIESNRKFIILRIRYNLAVAHFGSVAANQVLIEEDAQVARAVDALPRAQSLAVAAKKSFKKK